jgi:DNA-directed RNA polymerase subunit RPC12/RpoP
MSTQFRINCPECGTPMLVEGHYEDSEPESGYTGYAVIEQAVVKCEECEHRLSDTERDHIERRIFRFPKSFDPYYLEEFGG